MISQEGQGMSDKLSQLKKENEELKADLEYYKKMVCGYENVLKLNEKEMGNAREIIKMYEQVVELARDELMDTKETENARERVSLLSRDELMRAFDKIEELEEQNKKIKEQMAKHTDSYK